VKEDHESENAFVMFDSDGDPIKAEICDGTILITIVHEEIGEKSMVSFTPARGLAFAQKLEVLCAKELSDRN